MWTEVQRNQIERRSLAGSIIRDTVYTFLGCTDETLPEYLGSFGTEVGNSDSRFFLVEFERRQVPILFRARIRISDLLTQVAGGEPINVVYTQRLTKPVERCL